jgi:hypothetical protein
MAKRSTFQVVLTPDLTSLAAVSIPSKWTEQHALTALDALPGEHYQAEFRVAGRTFGYYPADSAILLNDLIAGSNFVREGKRGTLTLVGYPVLFADVGRDAVLFGGPIKENVFASVPRAEVQREFDTALAMVWGVISERSREGARS